MNNKEPSEKVYIPIVNIVSFIVAGITSWKTVSPISFTGGIGFIILWILSAIVFLNVGQFILGLFFNKPVKSKYINKNDFKDYIPELSREEVDEANSKIIQNIGITDLDTLIWERIKTAYQYDWCVEAYIMDVKNEYLDLVLLIPKDLNLPLKELMKTYKKCKLHPYQYQTGKIEFDEIDKANFLGRNINVQITSVNEEKQRILVKPYKQI